MATDNNGWVKLHRKLLKSEVFRNEKLLKVWVWCLLKATHQEYEQLVGLQVVPLAKGQFIYGRKSASKELDINESTIRKYMKTLELMGCISVKSTNKYSVVTVEKWTLYQCDEGESYQQSANKVPTECQQSTTNKNKKNNKEHKEDTAPAVIEILTNTGELYGVIQDDVDMWANCYPAVDVLQELRNMKAWSLSNPTKRKTAEDMKRFINGWLAKEQNKGGNKSAAKGSNYSKPIEPRKYKEFDPEPQIAAEPMDDATRKAIYGKLGKALD